MATALWGGVRGGVASLGPRSNTPLWLSFGSFFGPKMAEIAPRMALRWHQDGSKMQDISRWLLLVSRWPVMAQCVSKMASTWLPDSSKIVLSPRRRAHFAEVLPLRRDGRKLSKITSKHGPKMVQEAPRWPQDGPKRPQDGPKTAPRWTQEGPETALTGVPGSVFSL